MRQTREVKETNQGVYLWKTPEGYIADDEGHYYMIESTEFDMEKIALLRDGVRTNFGIIEGRPVFYRGHRIVDDETFEIQKERHRLGLTPDVRDILQGRDD